MLKTKLIIFCFSFASIVEAGSLPPEGTLKCSANSTVLFTVNGVATTGQGASINMKAVRKIADANRYAVDLNGKVSVRMIYNPKKDLDQDGLEAIAQELRSRFKVKNPWKYIQLALIYSDNVITTSSQTALASSLFAPLVAPVSFMALQFAKSRIKKSLDESSILELADQKVFLSVKEAVQSELEATKKVIIIPHSQGNTVVNAAMEELKIINKFPTKYNPFLGVLHIATPSAHMAISKYALIKLNTDLVVNNPIVAANAIQSNYVEKGVPEGSFVVKMLANSIDWVNSDTDISRHGMVDTYLSNLIEAKKEGEVGTRSMASIFKENLIKVAEKLEDNCSFPVINISSPEISENADQLGQYLVNGFAGINRKVLLQASDVTDTDPTKTTKFTWEFLEVVRGQNDAGEPYNFLKKVVKSPVGSETNHAMEVDLPTNFLDYVVKISATNKNGKNSIASFNLINKKNRAPVLSDYKSQCILDSYGMTSMSFKFSYLLDDDSSLSNYVSEVDTELRHGLPPQSIVQVDPQGLSSNSISRVNPCPNYFSASGATAMCDKFTSTINVTYRSVRGASLYFTGTNGSVSNTVQGIEFDPTTNTQTVAYRYPWPIYPNTLPVEIDVSIFDAYGGKMHEVGKVILKVCNP